MTRPDDNLADRDDLAIQIVDALERRRRNARHGANTPRVLPALVLARRFKIRDGGSDGGSDDSRKRGVREIVQRLRREGVPVLADRRGYYLPLGAADHAEYQAFRRRNGLAHLAAAAADARSVAASDAAGQGTLFPIGPLTRF